MRFGQRLPFLVGNHDERMDVPLEVAPFLLEGLADALGNDAVLDQAVHHFGQGKAMFACSRLFAGFVHGGQ